MNNDQENLIKLVLTATNYPSPHVARLLQQETNAGTLSYKDTILTTAVVSSLRSLHVYTPLVGATFGGLALLAIRGRAISFPRRLLIITTAVSVGHILPASVGSFKYKAYVKQLEDPPSVLQALKNVSQKARLPMGEESDFSVDSPFESSPRNSDGISSEAPRQPQPVVQPVGKATETQKPSSRWDEIRGVNSNKAPASSWDVLRQKHERTQIPVTADASPQTDADQDRTRAQVEFDAMVDRERNMK